MRKTCIKFSVCLICRSQQTVPLLLFVSNKEKLTLAIWRLWELLNSTWAEKHSMRRQGSPEIKIQDIQRQLFTERVWRVHSPIASTLVSELQPSFIFQKWKPSKQECPASWGWVTCPAWWPKTTHTEREAGFIYFFSVSYIQWMVFLLNWKESGFLDRYRILKTTCKYSLFL